MIHLLGAAPLRQLLPATAAAVGLLADSVLALLAQSEDCPWSRSHHPQSYLEALILVLPPANQEPP